MFIKLHNLYITGEIFTYMEPFEITKLDINRIYRYIEKFHNINTSYSYNDSNIEIDIYLLLPSNAHSIYLELPLIVLLNDDSYMTEDSHKMPDLLLMHTLDR